VAGLLSGLSLVEPGAVHPARWRPDSSDDDSFARIPAVAVVGR
jgi:hypothetical protein